VSDLELLLHVVREAGDGKSLVCCYFRMRSLQRALTGLLRAELLPEPVEDLVDLVADVGGFIFDYSFDQPSHASVCWDWRRGWCRR
jgi:hypothetical protein